MRFLDYNVSDLKKSLRDTTKEIYITDESFRIHMMEIRNNLNSIWKVLFGVLKKVNINNASFYYALISIIFDSKKTVSYEDKSVFGEHGTDIIAHILAIRNMKLKGRYWLVNPQAFTQLRGFENFHNNGRNFMLALKENPNFAMSSAFILGVPTEAYKPDHFIPKSMIGNAFEYYRMYLLPNIGFYDVKNEFIRPVRAPDTVSGEMLNQLRTLEGTAFINV